MKKEIILIVVLLLITVSLVSLILFQRAAGPHDGVVKSAGEYKIEMKNSYPDFYAFLLDKKNIPVSNKGITCEVKFIFPDSSNIYTSLKPYGKEGFSLKSAALRFCSCQIHFITGGKTVSAAFENENPVAVNK